MRRTIVLVLALLALLALSPAVPASVTQADATLGYSEANFQARTQPTPANGSLAVPQSSFSNSKSERTLTAPTCSEGISYTGHETVVNETGEVGGGGCNGTMGCAKCLVECRFEPPTFIGGLVTDTADTTRVDGTGCNGTVLRSKCLECRSEPPTFIGGLIADATDSADTAGVDEWDVSSFCTGYLS